MLLAGDFDIFCRAPWSVHGADCTRRECLLLGGAWENPMTHFDNIWQVRARPGRLTRALSHALAHALLLARQSLLTLFEMSSTEGWLDVMWNGVDSVGVGHQPVLNGSWSPLAFFIGFMVVGKFFVLNLFTGAIISKFLHMQRTQSGFSALTDSQREWVKAQQQLLSTHSKTQAPYPGCPQVEQMLKMTAAELAGVLEDVGEAEEAADARALAATVGDDEGLKADLIQRVLGAKNSEN